MSLKESPAGDIRSCEGKGKEVLEIYHLITPSFVCVCVCVSWRAEGSDRIGIGIGARTCGSGFLFVGRKCGQKSLSPGCWTVGGKRLPVGPDGQLLPILLPPLTPFIPYLPTYLLFKKRNIEASTWSRRSRSLLSNLLRYRLPQIKKGSLFQPYQMSIYKIHQY
jgi:hypothetical protein